jgi:hypothetical protein
MSDIVAWLDRLGLGKYAPVFADNDVDLDILRRLSEEDLRELGLPLGARRRILHAVAEPREEGPTTPTSQGAPRAAVLPTGPERRQITVMFSDVVGSTSLAERVDVEDLRSLVLAYQQACAGAIERHGGYVAQYLGDGVLAYFGYPVAHEDDAVRAVRASLAIIERMPGDQYAGALGPWSRVRDPHRPPYGPRRRGRNGCGRNTRAARHR